MINDIRQYIIAITCGAIFTSAVRGLFKENTGTAQIIKILSGVFLMITVLSPWIHPEFRSAEQFYQDFAKEGSFYSQNGKDMAYDELHKVIKEQSQAYIVDKAADLGANISAEIRLTDQYPPVPCTVIIKGAVSPYVKQELKSYLENQMGISGVDQVWIQ